MIDVAQAVEQDFKSQRVNVVNDVPVPRYALPLIPPFGSTQDDRFPE
jgi:hypothetical protein